MESIAGAAGTNGSMSHFMNMADPNQTTTHALVAYLRMEADLADEKAKRLRAQAEALSERYGVTDEMQSQYELNPDQLPPLNEQGLPKYKGKKRGRKPKPRKRKLDPNRRKRQHTAYTLFVQEIYPSVKAQHSDLQSKEVISIVAKQWKAMMADEKREWKLRAKATHEEEDDDHEVEEEDDNTDHGEILDDDDGGANHLVEVVVGGEAEATAAADAVYQQTVAEMEADDVVEGEDDDNDNVDETDEDQEEAVAFHDTEIEEIEEVEEEEPEEPPPPAKRRRGRPKKS